VEFLCRGMQLLTCSADGLLKLWSVKTSECTQTCSEHEAKVWALAVSADQRRFVSGGADSALLVWRDVHLEEAREQAESAALRATEEQALANLVQQRQWLRALRLAIRLKRPFRCLQILQELRREPDGAEQRLADVLKRLRDDQLDDLLQFVVEWNTNSKHCHEAQLVVNVLLKLRGPEAWRQLPSFRTLLEGLLPYTDRHLERMNRLLQSIAFIDYTAGCMKVTSRPGVDAAVEAYADEHLFTEDKPALKLEDQADIGEDEADEGEKAEEGEAAAIGSPPENESSDSGLETEEPAQATRKEPARVTRKEPAQATRKEPAKVTRKEPAQATRKELAKVTSKPTKRRLNNSAAKGIGRKKSKV